MAASAWGSDLVTEAIPLTSRTAEEMIPVVRPLLVSGGSVSGVRNTLIIKTTPDNLARIREALNGIDHRARSLVVRLKSIEESAGANAQASVSGDAGFSGSRVQLGGSAQNPRVSSSLSGGHIQVGSSGTETRRINSSVQQVRVVDGGHASIQGGGFVFNVSPKLSGDQVTLAIETQSLDANGRSRGGTRTELSGALGRWMPVSGIDRSGAAGESSLGSRSSAAGNSGSRLYLRVDETR